MKSFRIGLLVQVVLVTLLTSDLLSAADVAIIGKSTVWSRHIVKATEEIRFEDGTVAPGKFSRHRRRFSLKGTREASSSLLPPEDWMAVDFDDRSWPRRRLPLATGRTREFSLMCVRTQFNVADPAKLGDLTLSVAYRGGVVVYLNGEELARSDMPEGKIGLLTLASDYPKDAYLNPKGFLLRVGWKDPANYKDRFAKRDRSLNDVTVPASKLRKGVNVLALQVHRPPTDAILYNGRPEKHEWHYCQWQTLRLDRVSLTAADANGLASHPKGLSVTNAMTVSRWISNDPGNVVGSTLRPVQIDGARNGAFSGQVILSSSEPIEGLKVVASDLTGSGGSVLKMGAVQVRYPAGDSLLERAPVEVGVNKKSGIATQPLWVTLHVPNDAKPGNYEGSLTVSANDAGTVTVPLKLSIADWTVPDPSDLPARFDLVQSPETLAKKYNVALWSDAHWKLIDRSFELMGQIGSRVLYIPLHRQSHMGNEHSMVRWIKKTDGTWDHDFSIVEKYLDTALKRVGKLDMICLQAWAVRSGGSYFGMASHKKKGMPYRFSILDPETGKLTEAEGPMWTDQDQATEFLKPVFDGIRKLAKARGIESALMIGTGHDVVPRKKCVAALKEASGGMPWVMHCHPPRWKCGSERVGYLSHVWSIKGPSMDPKLRRYGWKETRLYTTFPREGSGVIGRITDSSAPMQYRLVSETAMCTALNGIGWVGADFWPVIKTHRGMAPYLDYYPTYDFRANLGIGHAITHILDPGPDGPVATVRSEMVREGLQEAAARVFLEKILLDPEKKANLSTDLATKCQTLLDDRLRLLIRARSGWDLAICNGFEAKKAILFAMASEVAAAIKN